MAISKTVSLRIPSELLIKVDQLAEEKYSSHKGVPNRSLVILDAIAAYCDTLPDSVKEESGIVSSRTVTIEQFQSLQEIVYSLAEELKELQSKIIAVSGSVTINDLPDTKTEGATELVNELEAVEDIPSSVNEIENTTLNISNSHDIPRLSTESLLEELLGKSSTQIMPIMGKTLIKRLIAPSTGKNVSSSKLSTESKKSTDEFRQWTSELDIDNIQWEYRGRGIGYVPAGELSDELRSRLLKWIEKNS